MQRSERRELGTGSGNTIDSYLRSIIVRERPNDSSAVRERILHRARKNFFARNMRAGAAVHDAIVEHQEEGANPYV